MKVVSVRVIVYLAIFLAFVALIEGKKSQVAKEKAKEVESILSLMMENGAPVTTYKVIPKDFALKEKVTLKNCDASTCFYTSRDKKNKLNIGAKIYQQNSKQIIGEVTFISNSPDYRNGLYQVKVSVPNFQEQALVAEVETRTIKNTLVVPSQAIQDQNYLWTVNGSDASKVKIKVGHKNSQYSQVTEGIQEGQTIILDGANQIPIYKKINVINDSKDKKVAPNSEDAEAKS